MMPDSGLSDKTQRGSVFRGTLWYLGVMAKLRVQSFGVSLDGFGAGTDQSLEHPLGKRGPELMEWFFPTRRFQAMYGQGGGENGTDNGMAEQGFAGIGAWILGRNMFGPVRGPWPDDSWKGWWGTSHPITRPSSS